MNTVYPSDSMDAVLPPSDTAAERAVLGSCLISSEAVTAVSEILSPDDFYDLNYRDVFEAMQSLTADNQPVDMITLSDKLNGTGALERLGGQAFFASVIDSVPTAANATHHAKIVQEKALRRRLIEAGNSISRSGYDCSLPVSDILENTERAVFEISRHRNDVEFRSVSGMLPGVFAKAEEAYRDDSHGLTGVSSGFAGFDRLTGGLQKGSLYIIAARPSMGKTALAMNIARNVAVKTSLPVLVFSLEMGGEQLTTRLLASEARVNLQDMLSGCLSQTDWSDLSKAADRISRAKIFIDDSSVLSTAELKARSRRFSARHDGIALIVIDYLQLMNSSRVMESKQNEVAEISRSLKAVARELNVPVIALSQLSRAVETRNDKQPQLSDLRDSGAIEQDADLVGLLYRDSYYAREASERENSSAMLNIAKNRNGPTDIVPLVFLREFTRFEDRAFIPEHP